KLGHYEPARDRAVLSLSLDDQRVPEFVIEFVMYHELLHKQHREKWLNNRLFVHTPEFRQDERKFKQYEQAEQWLKKGIDFFYCR
ncbi:MAG: M48 family metallopeptidase, partial [Chroococcidiopsidaceae cyanobacterium CP_BM_ER_R8_30]|nr:M48 family metallopeptidase [Chroococcidiopsidaceae cyanobacterium CP_BM_ER_R8_30]